MSCKKLLVFFNLLLLAGTSTLLFASGAGRYFKVDPEDAEQAWQSHLAKRAEDMMDIDVPLANGAGDRMDIDAPFRLFSPVSISPVSQASSASSLPSAMSLSEVDEDIEMEEENDDPTEMLTIISRSDKNYFSKLIDTLGQKASSQSLFKALADRLPLVRDANGQILDRTYGVWFKQNHQGKKEDLLLYLVKNSGTYTLSFYWWDPDLEKDIHVITLHKSPSKKVIINDANPELFEKICNQLPLVTQFFNIVCPSINLTK